MTCSKNYAQIFYTKVLDHFLNNVGTNGLKFNDEVMKKEFHDFLTICLKQALDKTFTELGDIKFFK